MNDDARRLNQVQTTIEQLVNQGASQFRPGDVAAKLRELGEPIPVWELRAIFKSLAEQGVIEVDDASGHWSLKSDQQSIAAG